jgi:hypothetical protein
MFSLWRKIGTGATSRRRESRQCRLEVEGMETRALLSIVLSSPGSPIVESGTPTNLNVAFDQFGHGFASLTNPATGSLLAPPVPLFSVVASIAGNPATRAYLLPTAVDPGDVAIVNYQTGTLSDVLRFTDVVNPATNSVQGWLLVYPTPGTTAPPAGFNPTSPLNGLAETFGVVGLSVADYVTGQTVGVPPEEAFYSFQSEGNLIPVGLPS